MQPQNQSTASNPLKPVYGLVAILVLVLGGSALWRYFNQREEIVLWHDDFKAAQAEARKSGKPMFVYFTADWCQYCREMQNTTWADAEVEAALRDYVPVKVDCEQNPALVRRFGSELNEGIPAYLVIDAAAAASQGGPVIKRGVGLRSPEQFLEWLRS